MKTNRLQLGFGPGIGVGLGMTVERQHTIVLEVGDLENGLEPEAKTLLLKLTIANPTYGQGVPY